MPSPAPSRVAPLMSRIVIMTYGKIVTTYITCQYAEIHRQQDAGKHKASMVKAHQAIFWGFRPSFPFPWPGTENSAGNLKIGLMCWAQEKHKLKALFEPFGCWISGTDLWSRISSWSVCFADPFSMDCSTFKPSALCGFRMAPKKAVPFHCGEHYYAESWSPFPGSRCLSVELWRWWYRREADRAPVPRWRRPCHPFLLETASPPQCWKSR